MRITKFAHAHLAIETGGKRVVIDPGIFSPVEPQDDVAAIVLTHEHADHWSPELLAALLERNPGVPVFGPSAVADMAGRVSVTVVSAGSTIQAGPFTLSFVGGQHAHIHPTFGPMANLGVVVNDTIFHPGDSYTLPPSPVLMAAVPIGGPWHKLEETIDWLSAFTPPLMVNLHDAFLAEAGQRMAATVLTDVATGWGGRYAALRPGEFLDLEDPAAAASAP